MRLTSVSKSPPPSTQLSPLCWKIGQDLVKTNTTIATTPTPISNDTAPSIRSARWSGHGFRSRSIIGSRAAQPTVLADHDPLAGDDLFWRRCNVDPDYKRPLMNLWGD